MTFWPERRLYEYGNAFSHAERHQVHDARTKNVARKADPTFVVLGG
jgi:hypothetical protein